MNQDPVLITGATGYVGGRLIPLLLSRGYQVRAMARTPAKLSCRPWANHANLEIVQADIFDPDSLTKALTGCQAAYYLIHSMHGGNKDFSKADRTAAVNMTKAAKQAGLGRIIYLSGMVGDQPTPLKGLSAHLRSRAEVGQILSGSDTPTTILRAAQILGSGSASFEIIRYLVDRLPIMITPRWVNTQAQPISIKDVLDYLAGCLETPETIGQTFDVGGPDIVTYRKLFQLYAEVAGLRKRIILPVPLLSPRLSSYWVGLITPVPSALAKPLILGLKTRVVCSENRIRDLIPLELSDCHTTLTRALDRVKEQTVPTCFSDAGRLEEPELVACGDAPYSGGTVKGLTYSTLLEAEPSEIWHHVQRIGGENGWYAWNSLWKFRGFLDTLVGGIGLRRGRRDPVHIYPGDALDFWRVLDVQENKRLLLQAEMTVPGEALLEFIVEEQGPGKTRFSQRSKFLPRGLWGLLYWWLTYIPHKLVFKGMLKAMARKVDKPMLEKPGVLKKQAAQACKLPEEK